MDFMQEIKKLLMDRMGGQQPPPSADPAMRSDPWNDPSLAPPPIQPRPSPSPGPTPRPTDPFIQAEQLAKQREIWKRLIPQELWNK